MTEAAAFDMLLMNRSWCPMQPEIHDEEAYSWLRNFVHIRVETRPVSPISSTGKLNKNNFNNYILVIYNTCSELLIY